ncbi:MAG: DUF1810 family protein [Candidatus Sulfotelmatobacter sp.]
MFWQVCAELYAGRKDSHWTWFVFPPTEGPRVKCNLGRIWDIL